ncbi:hypothetical protein T484DRAFT_3454654 [Baffinella frigidus]|nr:hypothetical protein T484DRAFT_3454654 [Cryptophyta sp. CCMP2293]
MPKRGTRKCPPKLHRMSKNGVRKAFRAEALALNPDPTPYTLHPQPDPATDTLNPVPGRPWPFQAPRRGWPTVGPSFRYLIRRNPPMPLRIAYRRSVGLVA